MARYESPTYEVVVKEEAFELRRYESFEIAAVEMNNRNDGFRVLFRYISGANRKQEKISMTVPVLQKEEDRQQIMSFVVPKQFRGGAPVPSDDSVSIQRIEWPEMAVIRFSGMASEYKIHAKEKKLMEWIHQKGWQIQGERILAFYDPPFQVPFLRRNEVLIGVKRERKVDDGER